MANKVVSKIADLAKDLGYTNQEVQSLNEEIIKRSLSRFLIKLRTNEDVTQKEMEKRLGKSQSYVSKLENSNDENISVNELINYVEALGFEGNISVSKPKTLMEKIQSQYNGLINYFDKLQVLQREDDTIQAGLANFERTASRYMQSLSIALLKSSNSKVNAIKKSKSQIINLEDSIVEKDLQNPTESGMIARS